MSTNNGDSVTSPPAAMTASIIRFSRFSTKTFQPAAGAVRPGFPLASLMHRSRLTRRIGERDPVVRKQRGGHSFPRKIALRTHARLASQAFPERPVLRQ